jgi:hypothetical protein
MPVRKIIRDREFSDPFLNGQGGLIASIQINRITPLVRVVAKRIRTDRSAYDHSNCRALRAFPRLSSAECADPADGNHEAHARSPASWRDRRPIQRSNVNIRYRRIPTQVIKHRKSRNPVIIV